MQTVAQKSALRAPVARPSRSSVVVRASAESRRSVLTGFVAGAAALVAGSATAATSVDIFDDRAARARGFDIIYEARDLSLDQATRDGLSQPRKSLAEAKARAKESEARLDTGLEPYIQKAYWTEAREQLRRQVGTLRFDLNTLAESKPKEAKKAALALKKTFLTKVEDLDFSLRSKNKEASLAKLALAKTSLDAVLAAVA